MSIRNLINRFGILVIASGWSILFFILIIASPTVHHEAPVSAPQDMTLWQMIYPEANTWVTSTVPITVQVRVTNTSGIHTDAATYEELWPGGVTYDGIAQVTPVDTQTIILAVGSVTLSEGVGNTITFTIITSDTQNPFQSMPFNLKLDSAPPTGVVSLPVSSSVWAPGDTVSVTWAISDTTSGLTATKVLFRLSPDAVPVLISSTAGTSITWAVPHITNSNQANILLLASDLAGNLNVIASQPFSVTALLNKYAYLPVVTGSCATQIMDWCEPNNTITTAFPIALNYTITASVNMTPDFFDYYRVSLNSVRPYTITLRLIPPCADPPAIGAKCDLDLLLRSTNPPFTYVAQSSIANIGNEQIVYTPTMGTTGDYGILVWAYNTTVTPTLYTLIAK